MYDRGDYSTVPNSYLKLARKSKRLGYIFSTTELHIILLIIEMKQRYHIL